MLGLFLNVVLIAAGFALLAKGGDILVEGASAVAKRFNVSDLVIGLTVVALGTSAPELAVSLVSAIRGSSEIVIGNVLGSNIANLCLVLGGAGLLAPIAIGRGTVWREIPFCTGTAVLLAVLTLAGSGPVLITRPEACFLLAGLAAYLLYMRTIATQGPDLPDVTPHAMRPATALLLIALGITGLAFGGELIVRNSIVLARHFGVSQTLIGVTIVAIGTSLPELATSFAAVVKGKPDIAVGNVVGSNILNTTLVLGVAGLLRPIEASPLLSIDATVALAATLVLFLFMFTGKRRSLDRWESALLLTAYAAYMVYVFWRR